MARLAHQRRQVFEMPDTVQQGGQMISAVAVVTTVGKSAGKR
ncbi:MAG TPA: hypothetical protein VGA78_06250 [Gemmatimonadales bacterium]